MPFYIYTIIPIFALNFLSSLQLQTNLRASHFCFFNFLGTSTTSQHFLLYIFRIFQKTPTLLHIKLYILLLYTYLIVFTFYNFYFLIVVLAVCFTYKPPPFIYLLVFFLFFYKNLVLAAAPDRHSHYFFHIISFIFLYVS